MGYGVDFPLSRLGKAIILWVIRVYGLPEVWVKRVSTVVAGREARLPGAYVSGVEGRSDSYDHGILRLAWK